MLQITVVEGEDIFLRAYKMFPAYSVTMDFKEQHKCLCFAFHDALLQIKSFISSTLSVNKATGT